VHKFHLSYISIKPFLQFDLEEDDSFQYTSSRDIKSFEDTNTYLFVSDLKLQWLEKHSNTHFKCQGTLNKTYSIISSYRPENGSGTIFGAYLGIHSSIFLILILVLYILLYFST